jgi:hypothetical protein
MWRLRCDSGWHSFDPSDRASPVVDGSRAIHTALGIGGQTGRVADSVRRGAIGTGQETRLSSTKVVCSRSSGAPARSNVGFHCIFVIVHAGFSRQRHGVVQVVDSFVTRQRSEGKSATIRGQPAAQCERNGLRDCERRCSLLDRQARCWQAIMSRCGERNGRQAFLGAAAKFLATHKAQVGRAEASVLRDSGK